MIINVNCGLMGCDAVWSCKWLSKFRRNITPTSSNLNLNTEAVRPHSFTTLISISVKHNHEWILKEAIMIYFKVDYYNGFSLERYQKNLQYIFSKNGW
jgi:hypothetical protein